MRTTARRKTKKERKEHTTAPLPQPGTPPLVLLLLLVHVPSRSGTLVGQKSHQQARNRAPSHPSTDLSLAFSALHIAFFILLFPGRPIFLPTKPYFSIKEGRKGLAMKVAGVRRASREKRNKVKAAWEQKRLSSSFNIRPSLS